MTTDYKTAEVERVSCEVCLKELPRSDAITPEAMDYVAYFCGLECHEKWVNQHTKSLSRVEKSSR